MITSVLTIMPSVDIDTDSDNSGTIERSDWEESIENEANYAGKYVRFNNNDDNMNEIADYQEYPGSQGWTAFSDSDLVQVILDRGFADLSGMTGWTFELKVTTGSDFGLKYWLDDEKSPIVNGTNNGLPMQITENGKSKDVYQWTVSSDGTIDYPSSIYVEGVNAYGKTDTLMWRLLEPVTPVQPDDATFVEKNVDTVKMTDPPLIDLAIDSDNTGDEAYPESSFWEDYVENHDYGVGKVIVPNVMVPIVVKMTNDDPIGSFSSGYNYNIVFSDYTITGPGAIKIYQSNQTDEIFKGCPIPLTSRTMTFYVVGVTQNNNVTTYEQVRDNEKQCTRITVTITSNGAPFMTDFERSDTLRYVVADRSSFYYKMVHQPELRAFAASDAAYSYDKDLPNFGMQVERNPFSMQTGLYAARYLDYNAGLGMNGKFNCIYAFRGTEINSLDDWENDIKQAMDYNSPQYSAAMMIGLKIKNAGLSNNYIFTGHSLGGGLASAAALFAMPRDNSTPAKKMAYTFNAAHFFEQTGRSLLKIIIIVRSQPLMSKDLKLLLEKATC